MALFPAGSLWRRSIADAAARCQNDPAPEGASACRAPRPDAWPPPASLPVRNAPGAAPALGETAGPIGPGFAGAGGGNARRRWRGHLPGPAQFVPNPSATPGIHAGDDLRPSRPGHRPCASAPFPPSPPRRRTTTSARPPRARSKTCRSRRTENKEALTRMRACHVVAANAMPGVIAGTIPGVKRSNGVSRATTRCPCPRSGPARRRTARRGVRPVRRPIRR